VGGLRFASGPQWWQWWVSGGQWWTSGGQWWISGGQRENRTPGRGSTSLSHFMLRWLVVEAKIGWRTRSRPIKCKGKYVNVKMVVRLFKPFDNIVYCFILCLTRDVFFYFNVLRVLFGLIQENTWKNREKYQDHGNLTENSEND